MASSSGAFRTLSTELKNMRSEPIEGFTLNVSDEDIFLWNVGIYGPPNTVYQGGYFKAILRFPPNYPFSPPSVKFSTKLWHPNVYENGDLCISILHPPVDDPHSGELPCERWNPTQNVRTILMSVISLLNEPNTNSPANVDASVAYRKWKAGSDTEYSDIVRKQVDESKLQAEKEGIKVPETLEEYCIKTVPPQTDDDGLDGFDMDDDEMYYEDDEEEEDHCEAADDDDDDSGQGEN